MTSIPLLPANREARLLIGVLLTAFVLGVAGPFGQAERFLVFQRVGLWLGYLGVGIPLFWSLRSIAHRWISPKLFGPGIVGWSIVCIIGSLPMLGVVETFGLLEGRPLPQSWEAMARSWAEVLALSLPIMIVFDRFYRSTIRTELAAEGRIAASAGEPATLSTLGVLADEIVAVGAEGQYSRIYTPSTSKLVGVAFSEVVHALMPEHCGVDGLQIHRSWWVSYRAIGRLQRKGSAAEVTLINGIKVPVARRRVAALRQRGYEFRQNTTS